MERAGQGRQGFAPRVFLGKARGAGAMETGRCGEVNRARSGLANFGLAGDARLNGVGCAGRGKEWQVRNGQRGQVLRNVEG